MNILTKISVVLVVVLALFLSVVLIQMSTTQPNWKAKYESELLGKVAAQTQAMNNAMALYRAQRISEKLQGDLTSERRTSAETITNKNSAYEKLQTEKAATDANLSAFKADLTKLQTNLAVAQAEGTSREKIISDMRDVIKRLNEEGSALGKQVNQLSAEAVRWQNQLRINGIEIQDLKEQLARQQEQKNQTAGKPAETTSEGDVKIDGQITAASGNTASINIGSSKGIKKGMRLVVYRETRNSVQVLAHLQISEVDLSASAGLVVDRQGDVRQGDLVTTSVK